MPAAGAHAVTLEPTRLHNIPRSVNHLLAGRGDLARLSQVRKEGEDWLGWLRGRLDGELTSHITEVVTSDRPARWVLFVDSPAWCERLRYALAELTAELAARGAPLARWQLRVRRGPVAAARSAL